ncbi:hypothetical protein MgSA37_01982 [Mucilaginibacter gotjawali]|uniref:Uncharacterized protein n=2 Tax=Mucilaginibacter gotjawali TaxID=1550579 RepID=A0A839SQS5_9SPHI|nr:hypothetical protein [Mucilaginibacter gotjawali]BAU53811.1 hypothetical protein MgSA37_01982 [Mucilaginibacter gotjawali]
MNKITSSPDLQSQCEVKKPVKKPVSLQYIHFVNVKPGICYVNFDVGNILTKP